MKFKVGDIVRLKSNQKLYQIDSLTTESRYAPYAKLSFSGMLKYGSNLHKYAICEINTNKNYYYFINLVTEEDLEFCNSTKIRERLGIK